jgi:deoxyribodipyrimidine photo-lyase
MMNPVILWFRDDLRLADHAALLAAQETGQPIVPVFILDDTAAGQWRPGAASRWWLHLSLTALDRSLRDLGAGLVLRRGDSARIICDLRNDLHATAVFTGGGNEPWARRLDRNVADALGQTRLHRMRTTTLFPPDSIRTQAGGAYGVFTPFSRACLATGGPRPPRPAPDRIITPKLPASEKLEDWGLLPTQPDWAGDMLRTWIPGEQGALDRARRFIDGHLSHYADRRNQPGIDATSMLSPHLHFGEISAPTLWHLAHHRSADKGQETFIRELLWREFSANLLWHNADLPESPLRQEFAAMPWRDDPAGLRAWQRGRTGIPIVDAGMRQLWQIGWMHNRVRMIVASFLIKHLLIPWQTGQAWFWDTLVDADLANNAASWQWVAGCGADAAPYFRIFNPVLQGLKFDPEGEYVRRYVPELKRIDKKYVHAPWEASSLELAAADIQLGLTYPKPIVDLAAGRARALSAYDQIRANA